MSTNKTDTYEIELRDLMAVTIILDQVIHRRTIEESKTLDDTIGKPLTQFQARMVAWGLNDLEDLRDMRDRLFNKIPLEML